MSEDTIVLICIVAALNVVWFLVKRMNSKNRNDKGRDNSAQGDVGSSTSFSGGDGGSFGGGAGGDGGGGAD